jgi:two-component system chemotaxis response regulator CheY
MRTCLIVDDSRVVRAVARRILEELQFTSREAGDGQAALAACQEEIPDFVLLDWNMPVMNGLDFLKALRRLPGVRQPVVIFCTTENDINHIQQAIEAGADEYIMKPFASDVLQTKLVQVGLL